MLPLLVASIPVQPDRETARRWAEEELSKSEYDFSPGLLERLAAWLTERFGGLQLTEFGTGHFVVLALIIAVVVGFALFVAPKVFARRQTTEDRSVFDEDGMTREEYLALADAAVAARQWNDAYVALFQALVRSLEERLIIDPQPGRTAQEVSRDGSARVPGLAQELAHAATVFDAVRYGHRHCTSQDIESIRGLSSQVEVARIADFGMSRGVR